MFLLTTLIDNFFRLSHLIINDYILKILKHDIKSNIFAERLLNLLHVAASNFFLRGVVHEIQPRKVLGSILQNLRPGKKKKGLVRIGLTLKSGADPETFAGGVRSR